MRKIICKKCGTPIDADLGECPVCGTVYYILPEENADDSTRVWDTHAAAKASEIHAAINSEDALDKTKAVPQVPQKAIQPTVTPAQKPVPVKTSHRPYDHDREPRKPIPQRKPQSGRRGPGKNWMFIVAAVLLLAILTVVMAVMSGAFNFGAKDAMPNLEGLNRDVAVNQLRALGISNPNIVYEDSDKPGGTVIEQSPKEGESLGSGTSVTLTVSSGTTVETATPETYIEVPNVMGDSYEVASSRLEAAGLVPVKGSEEYSETADEGQVTRQSPLSGAKVKQGDKVTLTVSKGKEQEEYNIIITAGKGGEISPSGSVTVKEGEDLSLTITPDEGYDLSQLRIDGESVGAPETYTLENVEAPHSVYAVFAATQEPDGSSGVPTESPTDESPISTQTPASASDLVT
ncbi:MAG: PASTA domain-containing protein [Oscillospiraceae bacterium]